MESDFNQLGLFNKTEKKSQSFHQQSMHGPLAHQMRPTELSHFVGQEHIFKKYPFLKDKICSLIFYGPPGCGKTTLAHLLAMQSGRELYLFNAVLGGIPELRKLIKRMHEVHAQQAERPILFIDEIHRFNKAQQDALLPYVEQGEFLLYGATTENPRVAINRALLSRLQILELHSLSESALQQIITKALVKTDQLWDQACIDFIAQNCDGDARKALNLIEQYHREAAPNLQQVKEQILSNSRHYDKAGDRHYDVISAFIKSMRGSDPNAALLYAAMMIDGGEDPIFIARRMIIFASEDIGNADPQALPLANAVHYAVQNIGMPEARINLYQGVTYLACALKSNAAYKAGDEALEFVRDKATIEVPAHLKNFPPAGTAPYRYPHDFPNHFVRQEYTSLKVPHFYQPSDNGTEKHLKNNQESRWS